MPPDERPARRVEEARRVLRALNFDAERSNERSALVLLALLGLTPDVPWSAATNPMLRTVEILTWLRQHYDRNYGPSTRETIRSFTLHQFVEAALVVPNPDEPNRPAYSPRSCYQIEPSALELLRHHDEDDFPARVRGYLANRPRLVNYYAKARKANRRGSETRTLRLRQEWVIGEQIGDGGFGRVYAAKSADREAVAKLVPKVPGAERELLFEDLAGVPNVVPIIDSGETKDAWVLIMPKAETSLRQHQVDAGGPLEAAEALGILTDIACALVGLDGRVVHRDLKPENVLLLDGHWCLADFGISRYAEATTAPDTRKYALTPPYAAPERWRFERATIATDVYAVGAIAYELLSGSLPFGGPMDYDFREQHLHGMPKPLDYLPAGLGALIDECLYKAPEARPGPSDLLARLPASPNRHLLLAWPSSKKPTAPRWLVGARWSGDSPKPKAKPLVAARSLTPQPQAWHGLPMRSRRRSCGPPQRPPSSRAGAADGVWGWTARSFGLRRSPLRPPRRGDRGHHRRSTSSRTPR